MIQPYYEEPGITIYHGDCREVLSTLELQSVEMILTDPPYGVGIDTWDTSTPHELLGLFQQLCRGTIVWFGAAPQLQTDVSQFDLKPQRIAIWAPRFTLSHTTSHGMAYRWHPIYLWNIPEKHHGPTWDLLTHKTECGNDWFYPCTKPLSLINELMGFAPVGSLVLDPYMGSGTMLRSAKDLGYDGIGIDISEYACEIAVNRLRQGVLPLAMET